VSDPVIAPRSLEREDGDGQQLMPETLCRDPVGNHSHPAEAGHQPEPSVAWFRSDPGCEAYTGSVQAVGWSPVTLIVAGADAVDRAEGRIEAPGKAGCRDPAGVEEQGMYAGGSPRNLGDLVLSVDRPGSGNRVIKPQAASGDCDPRDAERRNGRSHGTGARRQRSATGRKARGRSTS